MTIQIPDTCTFDGRRWAVERWDGDYSKIPTNEQIGIKTVTPHTANWSGRINHFVISRDRLYLLKIEVTLAEESLNILPRGAQREILCRYETMLVCDKAGEREEIREHRFEYLVFHNLPVAYSGRLYLSYPYVDYWEQPFDADDEEDERIEMLMIFEDGVLMYSGEL